MKKHLTLCILMLSVISVAQTYDAATDFDPNNNPAGNWSYGHSTSFGSLTLFGTQLTLAPGVVGWHRNPPGEPWVAKNITGSTVTMGTASVLAGKLLAHPSSDGHYAMFQFTAPTTGLYSYAASFEQRNSLPSSTDVHVVHNSTALWSFLSSTFAVPVSTSGSVLLSAGDKLTAAIGADGDYTNDWTGVEFTITAVPEPASAACLGLGVFIVGLKRRLLRNRQGPSRSSC